ncbi:hypothetical protein SLEP1_g17115 [Rubroshorea leprosula]|uniref:Uncharacterized protein n=1 Tax=Rubroshorea leprosula TaxID=152421 RepID=A0AAV5J221_9ROSI|nr:hypothetical protein SLEP1_g17115 [Rubroshorea leprosula]
MLTIEDGNKIPTSDCISPYLSLLTNGCAVIWSNNNSFSGC